jgi:hypothetical protein
VDQSFDGTHHKSQVNVVLDNLIGFYNPRVVVNNSDQPMAYTSWKDFTLAPNDRHGNALGVMKNAF